MSTGLSYNTQPRNTRMEKTWARSIQPKFRKILVQNQTERQFSKLQPLGVVRFPGKSGKLLFHCGFYFAYTLAQPDNCYSSGDRRFLQNAMFLFNTSRQTIKNTFYKLFALITKETLYLLLISCWPSRRKRRMTLSILASNIKCMNFKA